jgi:hypothetical protein
VVSTTHEVNGSVYSNWNVKNMPPRNLPQTAPIPAPAKPEDGDPLVNAEAVPTYPGGIRSEDEVPLVNAA